MLAYALLLCCSEGPQSLNTHDVQKWTPLSTSLRFVPPPPVVALPSLPSLCADARAATPIGGLAAASNAQVAVYSHTSFLSVSKYARTDALVFALNLSSPRLDMNLKVYASVCLLVCRFRRSVASGLWRKARVRPCDVSRSGWCSVVSLSQVPIIVTPNGAIVSPHVAGRSFWDVC